MNFRNLADLDLVVFDLDGTLIDSNGVNNELDIELVHLLGEKKMSPEEILKERNDTFKNSKGGDIYLNYCEYLKTKYKSNLTEKEILQTRRNLSKLNLNQMQIK